jgi:hypothetical protein
VRVAAGRAFGYGGYLAEATAIFAAPPADAGPEGVVSPAFEELRWIDRPAACLA